MVGRLRAFLTDGGAIQDAVGEDNAEAIAIEERLQAADMLARDTETHQSCELRRSILKLVRRVEVLRERVEIHLSRKAVRRLGSNSAEATALLSEVGDLFVLTAPAARARIGKEIRLVIAPSQEASPVRRDPALIKLIVKAQAARRAVETATQMSLEELLELEVTLVIISVCF